MKPSPIMFYQRGRFFTDATCIDARHVYYSLSMKLDIMFVV